MFQHASLQQRAIVAASAKDIWIKENLLLITAKIKGGNSGGPVIKDNGFVIGITSQKAFGEGDYDDLGYGTIIPIEYLNDVINNSTKVLDVSKISFNDFNEE